MKHYSKPIISIDTDVTEGIYTASGAEIAISDPTVIADWSGSGQAKFTLDLSKMNPSQLTVILTFNMDISSGWGGGASAQTSGHNLTLNWYDAPTSAEITIQANGDINKLHCTGYSYTNAN